MSNPEFVLQPSDALAPADVPREKEIRDWIVSRVARELAVDAAEIEVDAPFSRYGLDSVAAVHLVSDLEEWLKVELYPTLPYEYPTAQSMARYLTSVAGPAN